MIESMQKKSLTLKELHRLFRIGRSVIGLMPRCWQDWSTENKFGPINLQGLNLFGVSNKLLR